MWPENSELLPLQPAILVSHVSFFSGVVGDGYSDSNWAVCVDWGDSSAAEQT